MTKRDEFTDQVRAATAQRAAYRCSNPRCRMLTVKPHTNEGRAVVSGVAGHICAAAPGGPRFDPNQTLQERKSPANAIWVCHTCSDLIDKNPDKYTVDLLLKWKKEHEAWVEGENFVPTFPRVVLKTLDGLILPGGQPSTVDGKAAVMFRDHAFDLHATSRHEIHQLKMRVQFPESVVSCNVVEKPVGVEVQVHPERPSMVARVHGGGQVTSRGSQHPTNIFIISVERLVPERPPKLLLRTLQGVADRRMRDPEAHIGAGTTLFTWAEGSFLYKDEGQFFERRFIVPISTDGARSYFAESPEEDGDQRTLMRLTFFG